LFIAREEKEEAKRWTTEGRDKVVKDWRRRSEGHTHI